MAAFPWRSKSPRTDYVATRTVTGIRGFAFRREAALPFRFATSKKLLEDIVARSASSPASPYVRRRRRRMSRSEEHTSELQSRLHLVCRLLLEKKKPESKIAL